MKQSVKTIPALLFLSLVLLTQSFAQDMIAANKVLAENRSVSTVEVNSNEIRVEQNFAVLYPNATKVQWKVTADNSFVFFLNDNRPARASFNENGAVNYVITDCGLLDLPKNFGKYIKNKYTDYKLFHAIEIIAYGETAYQAIMENGTNFITLKYTANGVEKIQRVKKL